MDLAHGADRPGLDQFHHPPVVLGRMDLCSHLGSDAGFGGGLGDDPRFPDAMGQRFFAENVLAELDGGHHGKRVRVLRRGHDHGVDVVAGVVELTEIHVFPRQGILGGGGVQVLLINVAECDDVLGANLGSVGRPASAGADDGDIELLVGRNPAGFGPGTGTAAEHGCTGGEGRITEELTTRERVARGGRCAHNSFLRLSNWRDKHILDK